MYCHKCGKEISDDAVVCTHCGVETKNLNRASAEAGSAASSSAATANVTVRVPKQYNALVDFFMILFTGGLWIIWMLVRPK